MMYNFINNFTLSVTQKKDNKQEEASLIFSTPSVEANERLIGRQ